MEEQRFVRTTLAGAVAIVAWLAPLSVQAQEQVGRREAVVNTRSYAPIPKSKLIWIESEDNSDLNSRLYDLIAQEMKRQGYQLGEAGAVTLYYNASTPITEGSDRGTRRSALRGAPGRRDDRGQLIETDPQFRTRPGGIFGQPESSIIDTYSMNIIITERGGGQFWVGTSTASVPRADSYAVSVSLTRSLFRQLGKTVTDMRVPID